MISQKDIGKIKKIVEEFFQKMTIEAEIEAKAQAGQTFLIDLETEDPQILIGEGGKTLNEIQHLLKAVLKRKLFSKEEIQEPFFIDLDISNYKKKKYQYLKELARSLADEVSLTKKEKVLSPMSAAERRIIHLELAKRKDVATESIGQEPERRLVIRPYP
jgi:spoIIIJ-associated protein